MRKFLFACSVLICISLSSVALAENYISKQLNKPVPGGIAVVDISAFTQDHANVRVTYQSNPVLVVSSEGQTLAIVGIPLKTPSGRQSIAIMTANKTVTARFDVTQKRYDEQRIKLKNNKHVTPSAQNLARFKRELEEQLSAYKQFRPSTPSNVVLDRPVSGGHYSSPFGLRRFFNGEERNPHSGLDIAVPSGTPVKASAAGVITVANDFFFNGKTVFVDHGQGLISMYCHLSEISVTKGQSVARGERVGKVGSTGRSTGPHLHWSVSLNSTRVDPAIFLGAFKS